ncbi:ABC transporter substrate-binding protein [Alteribacter keqinensis]|uniref:ABC transporter substrate-binding protein n=1 Tax=Alteribacter keqinensis TaxID=2483800 RepID=A0A3M7TZW1_9BACI|nr:ABC transporter substrate-binding protein [Alteribacter keqinensis]RNA70294.1 ABC transporter substrate-binding protein [Alteribacter keqinensis]
MRKRLLPLVLTLLAACSTADGEENQEVLNKDWGEIEAGAADTEVRLYMWGGDEAINSYIDEWAAPRLEDLHGIKLTRVPMDTPDVLQRLQTERQAGQRDGSVDVMWINGENFRNAKERDLLYGSFSDILPNMEQYVDENSLDHQVDFGTDVDGYEAPWGKVQFVFVYDSEKVDTPPESFEELAEWIEDNPGKFTYPEATDFTGNAFLRHLLYSQFDEPEELLQMRSDDDEVEEKAAGVWQYLNRIEVNLWREGQTYPASITELDRLFWRGEVWMTMGYNEARVVNKVEEGSFPDSVRTFVLDSGSIGNTHFLSIPFNAPNPKGAMVVINELLSPEAQLEKLSPEGWGENTVLDVSLLLDEERSAFEAVDRGESVLDAETLGEAFLPELDAQFVPWLEEKWFENVVSGE